MFIRAHGGWDAFSTILLEETGCSSHLDALRRERELIEQLQATLNHAVPTRTRKEYHDKYYSHNQEAIHEKRKTYREETKDKLAEYFDKYRKENRQVICEHSRQHYTENKDRIQGRRKAYYLFPQPTARRFGHKGQWKGEQKKDDQASPPRRLTRGHGNLGCHKRAKVGVACEKALNPEGAYPHNTAHRETSHRESVAEPEELAPAPSRV